MGKLKKYAIHHKPDVAIVAGKFCRGFSDREVRVMAEAEGYAMVRRKGCYPYVCPVHELEPA